MAIQTSAGATLRLSKDGDPNFRVYATTDSGGRYLFDGKSTGDHTGLSPGTYTIQLVTVSTYHGADTVGTLWSLATGNASQDSSTYGLAHNGDSLVNNITSIQVTSDTAGTGYNFGEFAYPIDLLSLSLLMASDVPQIANPMPMIPASPPASVPEPGTLWLLVCMAGLSVAARVRRIIENPFREAALE
jgi:hypothetical protein